MKAAVLRATNEPFSIEEVELIRDLPHRVVVKTHASPFCSTDVKNWQGKLFKIPPTILGHASIGEVIEIGPEVTKVRVGQRVVVPGTPECGVCYYCGIGEPWQCSELFDLGGIYPDIAMTSDGLPVSCAGCVGGYAELMSISENQVFPIESDLPSDVLSLLGCGITTGMGSVFNIAKVQPGESVAIFGAGHLGLWTLQAAVLARAATIILVEPHAGRRETGGRLGATRLIDPGAEDAADVIADMTDGRGVDVAIEAAGPATAQRDALMASRRGGRVVLTGFESGTTQVPLPQVQLALQSRAVLSAQNGNVHMMRDLPRYTKLIESGDLDASEIITRRYALEELDTARDRSGSLDDICGVITFDQ